MGEVGSLNRGKSKHRPRNDSRLYGGKYPFIQTGDVAKAGLLLEKHNQTYSEFGIEQSKLWSKGTLVITIAANIAGTSILNINAAFPDSIIGFESQNTDMIFIKNAIDHLSNKLKSKAETSSQANLNLAKLSELKIVIPNFEEQTSIGVFFNKLENLIAQNERKIDLLKQLKQAYSQKIFGQELRFAGFNDLWKKRKIVDLFEERSERSPHGQMISITMGSGVVLASSLDRKDNSSFDKSNYKVVRKNDIAYNSMRMWQGASGVSPYNGIVSPAYTIITPKDNVDSGFFAIQFKMAKSLKTFQKYSQGLTSDTWNLKYPALSSIPMITPDFTEQKKINHFFGIFDDLIDKYEKKVLLLKRKKRSYLQKMFV